MYLYSYTLKESSCVQIAINGNFRGSKFNEIAVSRGKVLELFNMVDSMQAGGKSTFQIINHSKVFGHIRTMSTLRMAGASTDHLVIGSDSGNLVILYWNKERNRWRKVHQETYGKTGCRRVVPGQFVVVEPRGRACMLASLEAKKLVYLFSRDHSGNLTISSPQEANREGTLCFAVASLDTAFENPVFVSLELDLTNIDDDPTGVAATDAQKQLTLYELDLGLNTCIRKHSEAIDNGSNIIYSVPGGNDGPGGVLVCAENFVYYYNNDLEYCIKAIVPRRIDLPRSRSILITKCASFKNKKIGFFFLLQSEFGDLYKLTLQSTFDNNLVNDMSIKYFDSISPCSALCIIKTGYLFTFSEFGNHVLYKFVGLGESGETEVSSSSLRKKTIGTFEPVFFTPKKLCNLEPVKDLLSLCPIIDMKVENLLLEETPQIYVATGKSTSSNLSLLRPALTVIESISVDLPSRARDIFTIHISSKKTHDKYIILSFLTSTMVLAISTGSVNQVVDSGIQLDVMTLCVHLMTGNSILQVHSFGVRHILVEDHWREWNIDSIEQAACNENHVVLFICSFELVYLELELPSQQLVEKARIETNGNIPALTISASVNTNIRSCFVAFATHDSFVKLLTLDPAYLLQQVTLQCIEEAYVTSLLFFDPESTSTSCKQRHSWTVGPLYMQIGLNSGVLMRIDVDRLTGKFKEPKWKFLGLQPLKLVAVSVRGCKAMIALSKKPWIAYMEMERYFLSPLTYETIDGIVSVSAEEFIEGFIAIAGPKSSSDAFGTLRFINLGSLGEIFNQQSIGLSHTPRRLVMHPEAKNILLSETDLDHTLNPSSPQNDNNIHDSTECHSSTLSKYGDYRIWSSCIRLLDPCSMSIVFTKELDQGEAAISLALVTFRQAENIGKVAVVGTAMNLEPTTSGNRQSFISIYRFTTYGRTLELLHKTEVDGLPVELISFQGRLLAGIDIGSLSKINYYILECIRYWPSSAYIRHRSETHSSKG
jgi:splicing factor 3B subunit 3